MLNSKKNGNKMKETFLNMTDTLNIIFGNSNYSRDGKILWESPDNDEPRVETTVEEVEAIARRDPNHDWRIYYYAPTFEEEYKRQPDGRWRLIKKGPGFA